MMAHLMRYLDPLSTKKNKIKKNVFKLGPPPTKLSGSAHDSYTMVCLTVHGDDPQALASGLLP